MIWSKTNTNKHGDPAEIPASLPVPLTGNFSNSHNPSPARESIPPTIPHLESVSVLLRCDHASIRLRWHGIRLGMIGDFRDQIPPVQLWARPDLRMTGTARARLSVNSRWQSF